MHYFMLKIPGVHYTLYIPVMLRIKAGLIPVEADVRARLIFTSGFYSNQAFLCVSTLKLIQDATVYKMFDIYYV